MTTASRAPGAQEPEVHAPGRDASRARASSRRAAAPSRCPSRPGSTFALKSRARSGPSERIREPAPGARDDVGSSYSPQRKWPAVPTPFGSCSMATSAPGGYGVPGVPGNRRDPLESSGAVVRRRVADVVRRPRCSSRRRGGRGAIGEREQRVDERGEVVASSSCSSAIEPESSMTNRMSVAAAPGTICALQSVTAASGTVSHAAQPDSAARRVERMAVRMRMVRSGPRPAGAGARRRARRDEAAPRAGLTPELSGSRRFRDSAGPSACTQPPAGTTPR